MHEWTHVLSAPGRENFIAPTCKKCKVSCRWTILLWVESWTGREQIVALAQQVSNFKHPQPSSLFWISRVFYCRFSEKEFEFSDDMKDAMAKAAPTGKVMGATLTWEYLNHGNLYRKNVYARKNKWDVYCICKVVKPVYRRIDEVSFGRLR